TVVRDGNPARAGEVDHVAGHVGRASAPCALPGETLLAGLPGGAGGSRRPGWALRSRRTWRSRASGRAGWPGRPGRPLWTGFTGRTLGARRSGWSRRTGGSDEPRRRPAQRRLAGTTGWSSIDDASASRRVVHAHADVALVAVDEEDVP